LISHREDDLDRMEACAGGDVVVGVGVVHLVQAPEQGHRMDHDVLQVDGEIHGRDRDDEGGPLRQGQVVEQAPAALRRHGREGHGGEGQEEAHEDRVEYHQAQVRGPAPGAAVESGAARCGHFPEGHDGENAEEGGEPDRRLVGQGVLIECHPISSYTASCALHGGGYNSTNQLFNRLVE
jgi:hypothetical protein